MKRRVVITGMGAVAPNGIGLSNFWAATRDGVSGIAPITLFDASELPSRIAGEVKGFDPAAFGLNREQVEHRDRATQFALVASRMAVEDAALDFRLVDRERTGVCIATAVSGVTTMENAFVRLSDRGRKLVTGEGEGPEFRAALLAHSPSLEVSIDHGLYGPSIGLACGCTSGIDAAGYALQAIQDGDADVMINGGTDACVTLLTVDAFCIIGALSRRNDEPWRASRPFERDRDGFVIGEGAGTMVFEELEHAKARGARIYAEVLGYASTSNAYHMTSLQPDGVALSKCLDLCLKRSGVTPDDIDYVNAHGSSTAQNDRHETAAYKLSFGEERAYKIPVSSTKSVTGHTLGGVSTMELIACVMAIQEQVMPPTINYENPDRYCDLDYIPNVAREGKVDVALSNANGFGGLHSAMTIARYGWRDS